MSMHRQHGMTLIEVMIAMVIGLALMAGLAQVFISGRSSYNLQERMGDLQENGRFSLFFLQRSIRMAGYPKNVGTVTAFVTGTGKTVDGSGTNPDSISINYLAPAGGAIDCQGNTIAQGSTVSETYFIAAAATAPTGVKSLRCGTATNANQPMIEGVENMQIQYGVDADISNSEAAGYGYADFYTNAAGVTNWNAVVSVRVSVLASTIDPIYDEDASSDAKTYTLLDVSGIGPLADGVRGRVFTTTIEVRNRTSGI